MSRLPDASACDNCTGPAWVPCLGCGRLFCEECTVCGVCLACMAMRGDA